MPVTIPPLPFTGPVGAAVLVTVREVTVEPEANEPVPVATTRGGLKGNVLVTEPPGIANKILPETLEVADPLAPA